MKGMLSGGMLLAGSFERIGGASVLMLFEVLMVVGYGRRSERNGRLSPHMRAFLWGMAEGYASRRMFGVVRWLYAKLSPLCVNWQSIKRRLEG